MSLFCRVIQPSDIDALLNFENRKLAENIADENERNFHSWNARWRKEALEHYLPMGWSFMALSRDGATTGEQEILMGYFIAQPLLFVDGQTQSLWIEHMGYSSLQARDELCELAYKLCREKHFQKVLFPHLSGISNGLSSFKPEAWAPPTISVKTTKV